MSLLPFKLPLLIKLIFFLEPGRKCGYMFEWIKFFEIDLVLKPWVYWSKIMMILFILIILC